MAPRKSASDDPIRRVTALNPERASFRDEDADEPIFGRAERALRGARSRQAAASILSYYLEQSGAQLPEQRWRMLEKAKNELRQG